MKRHSTARVVSNESIAADIFDMIVEAPAIALDAVPGQFVSLYPDNGANLLARPISICEFDRAAGLLRLVYRVVGSGTREFAKKKPGQSIRMLGPLGNGFSLEKQKDIVLVGGGIGTPPLLGLAKQAKAAGLAVRVFLGFRDKPILLKDFAQTGADVHVATDDGGFGFHGNAAELLNKLAVTCDGLYACGPVPMLRAVAGYCLSKGIACQISLEERMACSVGACVGCVVKTGRNGIFAYRKVCQDGPVFDGAEVVFDA